MTEDATTTEEGAKPGTGRTRKVKKSEYFVQQQDNKSAANTWTEIAGPFDDTEAAKRAIRDKGLKGKLQIVAVKYRGNVKIKPVTKNVVEFG